MSGVTNEQGDEEFTTTIKRKGNESNTSSKKKWYGGYRKGEVWGERNVRTDANLQFLSAPAVLPSGGARQTEIRLWTEGEVLARSVVRAAADKAVDLAAGAKQEDDILNRAWENFCDLERLGEVSRLWPRPSWRT